MAYNWGALTLLGFFVNLVLIFGAIKSLYSFCVMIVCTSFKQTKVTIMQACTNAHFKKLRGAEIYEQNYVLRFVRYVLKLL